MDCATIFLMVSVWTLLYILKTKLGSRVSRLPPGPFPLPIIGSIFELREKPHLSLASLSKVYGPLMSLKLGSTITIVVSSPEVAKEILLKHDLSFSSRSLPDTMRVVDHHLFSMVWLPVGDQWRRLRRISKEHMFTAQQLDAGQLLRKEKMQQLLDYVHQFCKGRKAINLSSVVFTTTLNFISSFIFSVDMAHYDSLVSQELKDALSGLSDLAGKPNLADLFPILKPLDLQGLLQKANIHAEKLISILDRMVDQRVQVRAENLTSTSHDVLDLLLDLSQKNESEFSRNDIVHLLFDLFGAATDTTTSTLEWAMAELLHNREKLVKARSEVEEICGKDNMIIEESDIFKLPYLQAVIKETLRLHPPVPFLLPHKALCDVEVQGFMVPKDAQILCNVWAIGRDPSKWSEPHMFMPERFLGVDIDYKGRDFELIPFGSGRRICPGLPLGHRMLNLMLVSLICKFDWKLEGGMEPKDMDMSERFGLTLHKMVPLMVIPVEL